MLHCLFRDWPARPHKQPQQGRSRRLSAPHQKQNQVQNILPEDLQDNSSLQFRNILREGRTRVGIAAFSFTVTNPFLTSDNNTSTNNVVCA